MLQYSEVKKVMNLRLLAIVRLKTAIVSSNFQNPTVMPVIHTMIYLFGMVFETWSLNPKEECKVQVCKIKVPKTLHGPRRNDTLVESEYYKMRNYIHFY
jgi:hypothetical protein